MLCLRYVRRRPKTDPPHRLKLDVNCGGNHCQNPDCSPITIHEEKGHAKQNLKDEFRQL